VHAIGENATRGRQDPVHFDSWSEAAWPRASTTHWDWFGTLGRVNRQCSRPGCAEPSSVTLTYQYAQGAAWLDELTAEREPHAYDLCERHAGRLSVPHGWRLEDRRRAQLHLLAG
jgi:hypothetical protein